jgi:hypothetical protein
MLGVVALWDGMGCAGTDSLYVESKRKTCCSSPFRNKLVFSRPYPIYPLSSIHKSPSYKLNNRNNVGPTKHRKHKSGNLSSNSIFHLTACGHMRTSSSRESSSPHRQPHIGRRQRPCRRKTGTRCIAGPFHSRTRTRPHSGP